VELPVGASEDRLVGSLDIEKALADGVKAFEPGLRPATEPRYEESAIFNTSKPTAPARGRSTSAGRP
ncbi:hypothetical protein, partial [Streptomyces venezuelae]|uniref:hypothetical protein n=1 Tax=Streptomyces venezuelae TaxID=54571 RepID=UPI003636356B